jgi:hypothetical protein
VAIVYARNPHEGVLIPLHEVQNLLLFALTAFDLVAGIAASATLV